MRDNEEDIVREITTHKVNGLNEAIQIHVLDEPWAGGAHHVYQLTLEPNGAPVHSQRGIIANCYILFQNGPIAEAGVNGMSNEALLAIVRDRLACFQAGTYACKENEHALGHVITAMNWLRDRTKDRVARGVEGTSAV